MGIKLLGAEFKVEMAEMEMLGNQCTDHPTSLPLHRLRSSKYKKRCFILWSGTTTSPRHLDSHRRCMANHLDYPLR